MNASPESTSMPTFTASYQQLETILQQFKRGTPTLEESLALFEDGVQHLRICQQRLAHVKGRVEALIVNLAQPDSTVIVPFESGLLEEMSDL